MYHFFTIILVPTEGVPDTCSEASAPLTHEELEVSNVQHLAISESHLQGQILNPLKLLTCFSGGWNSPSFFLPMRKGGQG